MTTLIAKCQSLYVHIMLFVMGRALVAVTRIDEEAREEAKGFRDGYTIRMCVGYNGPGFTIKKQADGTFALANDVTDADLTARFKHIVHAFLSLSFQEGVTRAFANDRIVVDGDISSSIRLIRILNKLQSLILPKFIASVAVKRYIDVGLFEKITKTLRIYGSVTKQLIFGS